MIKGCSWDPADKCGEKRQLGKSQKEKYECSVSMLIFLVSLLNSVMESLSAGGRLWLDAIDYPAHWGLQSLRQFVNETSAGKK